MRLRTNALRSIVRIPSERTRLTLQRYTWVVGCVALAVLLGALPRPAAAAGSRVTVPLGALTGLRDAGPADGRTTLHLAVELQPRADLDGLAARMSDPTDPAHRQVLTHTAFVDRFGR